MPVVNASEKAGHIALQSVDDAVGWLRGDDYTGISELPTNADATHGPPARTDYSPLRALSFKSGLEYGGIGSHGGPVVSGRPDLDDVVVEKDIDKMSTHLFQASCTGQAFSWIHLVMVGNSAVTWIRLGSVNISSYQLNGVRFFGDRFDPTGAEQHSAPAMSSGGSAVNLSVGAYDKTVFTSGNGQTEKFTLWYTTIEMQVKTKITGGWSAWTGWKGWDGGTNSAIG